MAAAYDPQTPRARALQTTRLVTDVLHRLLLGLAVLFLLLIFLPYVTDVTHFGFLRWAAHLEWRLAHLLARFLPTRFAHYDFSHWLLIIGLLSLGQLCERASIRSADRLRYLSFKRDYDAWKHANNLADNAQVLSPVNQVLDQLQAGKLKDRNELLTIFAEAKRKLDEMARELAFLSIDVVDSTGLKVGEEKAAVEHDFKSYKLYVEDKLRAHHCLRTIWTPDGTMNCFASASDAVAAARAIIGGLPTFNQEMKTMQHDFRVRCGINVGSVYFDEARALEEVSDQVIDVAGHFQKNAAPNTLWITPSTLAALDKTDDFAPVGKVVQGQEAYAWQSGSR